MERKLKKKKTNKQKIGKFLSFPWLEKIRLIFEPGFLPNCVADSTQVSAFERAPDAFVHREGGDPSPRQLLRHHFVRRNPISIASFLILLLVVAFAPPVLPVLLLQYLRPVRHVHRQRPWRRPSDGGGRRPPRDSGVPVVLRRGGVAGAPHFGLVELEQGVGSDRRVAISCRQEAVVSSRREMSLGCGHS